MNSNKAFKIVPLSMIFPTVKGGASSHRDVVSVKFREGNEVSVSSGDDSLRNLVFVADRVQVIENRVHVQIPSRGLAGSPLESWEDSTVLESAPKELDSKPPDADPNPFVYEEMPDCVQESADFLADCVVNSKDVATELSSGLSSGRLAKPCSPCALLMLLEAVRFDNLVRERVKRIAR